MEHLLPWFALKSVPGVGNHLFKRLLERFHQPETVFETSRESLLEVDGISLNLASRLSGYRVPDDVMKMLDRLAGKEYKVVTYNDPSYPALLKEIPDPPPFLYAKGHLDPADRNIAMVGSRNATRYGIQVTHHLAGGLVSSGHTIVSGMAVGIDTAAHRGALENGGSTIAVLGSGLERIYPKQNLRLFHRIAEQGAVVTEFSPSTDPDAHHFPARNRIISGMSLGCVVVEAAPKSGSLITARLAAEQNREVFAVPGSIHSYKSGGTHALIKEGAKLVMHVGDILEELPQTRMNGEKCSRAPEPTSVQPPRRPSLNAEEQQVLQILEPYPVHIDELARALNWPSGKMAGILLQLELKGVARQSPGKLFSLAEAPS